MPAFTNQIELRAWWSRYKTAIDAMVQKNTGPKAVIYSRPKASQTHGRQDGQTEEQQPTAQETAQPCK